MTHTETTQEKEIKPCQAACLYTEAGWGHILFDQFFLAKMSDLKYEVKSNVILHNLQCLKSEGNHWTYRIDIFWCGRKCTHCQSLLSTTLFASLGLTPAAFLVTLSQTKVLHFYTEIITDWPLTPVSGFGASERWHYVTVTIAMMLVPLAANSGSRSWEKVNISDLWCKIHEVVAMCSALPPAHFNLSLLWTIWKKADCYNLIVVVMMAISDHFSTCSFNEVLLKGNLRNTCNTV